ncbi:MAG: cupredoxin domain-containing protein [Gaiellaceae bacterium]
MARFLAVAAAGLYLALPATAGHRDTPILNAVVGENDAYTIGLFFPDGTKVATLKPGTYTVVVHDESAIHNFHLASNFDSTVDFRTDIAFVGDQSFTVTFRPNTIYAYACEPHWQVMNGSFRTFAVVAPTPPTLRAAVSVTGRVPLSAKTGKAGRVKLVGRAHSPKFGFLLTGNGVDRRTTAAFVGTTIWTLNLKAGKYRFGSGILTAR